jgi:hypothetical protein
MERNLLAERGEVVMEAGCVIGKNDEVLFWHEPHGRSSGALPDSPRLWGVLWDAHQRGILKGFAHSHPGSGMPWPSDTDMSTFLAIERALGVRLTWWITSSDMLVVTTIVGEQRRQVSAIDDTPWVAELRQRSRY